MNVLSMVYWSIYDCRTEFAAVYGVARLGTMVIAIFINCYAMDPGSHSI